MTLAEQLEQTGVSLDNDVGYIYESLDETGVWHVEDAKIARVYNEIPELDPDLKKIKHYDPEYGIALQWVQEGALQLSIVIIRDDTDTYPVEDGVLMMESDDQRIRIGQTTDFMEDVYSALRVLKNMNREDTLH